MGAILKGLRYLKRVYFDPQPIEIAQQLAYIWLRILAAVWVVAGYGFIRQAIIEPDFGPTLVALVWASAFVIGGILSAVLSRNRQSRRLYEWTAGVVAVAPFARGFFIATFGHNMVFISRFYGALIWGFIGLTLALRWKDLVPHPATIDLPLEGDK